MRRSDRWRASLQAELSALPDSISRTAARSIFSTFQDWIEAAQAAGLDSVAATGDPDGHLELRRHRHQRGAGSDDAMVRAEAQDGGN